MERSGLNNLAVEAYSTGTTHLSNPRGDLVRASNVQLGTGYPGGLYLDGSFFVSRDVGEWWALKGAQRVVLRNGLALVYEGWISSICSIVGMEEMGMLVTCVGAWGQFLMSRRMRKRWADDRITEDVWAWPRALAADEKVTLDRQGRLRWTPKAVAWTATEFCRATYTMPTGTIKRVTFDFALAEAAQDWTVRVRSASGVEWSASASGTGNQDITLATPSSVLHFELFAGATQTPASDGTIYGQISNVVVYSETGSINLSEIAKDVRAAISDLSSSESLIGSNTYSLIPFMADGYETAADILTAAAGFGDSSFNRWAVLCDHSERAATPDGKPLLRVEQYPDLTDYEYAVSLEEAALELEQDFTDIRNNIVVEYVDSEGVTRYVDSSISAGLKDTASVAAYGQRDYLLSVGPATQTIAINAGKRCLAQYKDPQWRLAAPVMVQDYIRAKAGQPVPASEIVAGKRLKIESFTEDLIFVVTGVRYDDESETAQLTAGPLDEMLYMPGYAHPVQMPADALPASTTATGKAGPVKTETRSGFKWGMTSARWEKMTPAERRAWRAAHGGKKPKWEREVPVP